ncbi:hypothetical protein ACL02T_12990 [Pseudonocardia sp. RS010]|uniref:hypothetical protein n=1 Tax=Pseudonocardia sp. RS010 TaxID=3385979 RepID=UPI0039A0DFC0
MFGRWKEAALQDQVDAYEADSIVRAWNRACEGAGLVRTVDTVTGPTVIPPAVTFVVLGPPRRLTVRLQPGMTAQDIRAAAARLAPHLGAYSLRVEPRGLGEWVIVTLLDSDPLGDVYPLPGPAEDFDAPIVIARDEDGNRVAEAVSRTGHIVVQGSTGSGKSAWLYAFLSQLSDRNRAGFPLTIGGIDPSGILLRPFESGSLLGLKDPDAIERFLSEAVAKMDNRVASIPHDKDVLDITPEFPLLFLVLEEYPGLLRWLDALDAKQAKRVRALVARLLSEGRKAGFRLVLVAQRAEAGIIGANERAQCSLRLSFRVDNLDAVRLLHTDADTETAARHSSEVPGVALLSAPGRPLSRVRGPWVGGYAEYVSRVAA